MWPALVIPAQCRPGPDRGPRPQYGDSDSLEDTRRTVRERNCGHRTSGWQRQAESAELADAPSHSQNHRQAALAAATRMRAHGIRHGRPTVPRSSCATNSRGGPARVCHAEQSEASGQRTERALLLVRGPDPSLTLRACPERSRRDDKNDGAAPQNVVAHRSSARGQSS